MEERKLTALVSQAIAGDKGAFEELYAEHARSILFHVRTLIVDKENYTDVAQDVALEMFVHIKQLRKPAAFRGWMHQVVRTTCADHNRSLQSAEKHMSTGDNEELLESVEDEAYDIDPEAVTLANAEGNRLFAIISELSVPYREILVQRYYDDLSYKEIAEAQGISVTNVSTRLQRAMNAVRAKIGDLGEDYSTPSRGKDMKEETRHTEQQQERDAANRGQAPDGADTNVEPTQEELNRLGLNDDIGIKSSLLSGVPLLIPDDTVDAVVHSVETKLVGIDQAVTSTSTAVATSTKPPLIIGVISGFAVLIALVIGGAAIVTGDETPAPAASSAIEESYTVDYSSSMHIIFDDANGGDTDLNVREIKLVEDKPVAADASWQLLYLGARGESSGEAEPVAEPSVLASGTGMNVDTSVLAQLGPGNYQVIFMLFDKDGASAEASRSFAITE